MVELIRKSNLLLRDQSENPVRALYHTIDWNDRLIGILGARGTGKTTLLLQHLKSTFKNGEGLYLSLDDIYFSGHRLVEIAEQFRQTGGKTLYIDEVHKYPDWAREIKNIYDFYRDIRIVFTGSSVTDMLRQNADLSRRAIQYELPGLSYREYLYFSEIHSFPPVSLSDILKRHEQIAGDISSSIKPLKFFPDYLNHGYYPFFKEGILKYSLRIEQVVKMILDTDLRYIDGFDPRNMRKIQQLLYILAVNVPFKPNITKLSEKTGINRNTLVQYLDHLEKARLIKSLTASGKSISTLQKPDKIYLENTNLQEALAPGNTDKGTMRESFFLNQLEHSGHRITLPLAGDFLANDQYTFEVGGKDKSGSQIKGIKDAWIAADDIETGALNKIPLWLFGFLY